MVVGLSPCFLTGYQVRTAFSFKCFPPSSSLAPFSLQAGNGMPNPSYTLNLSKSLFYLLLPPNRTNSSAFQGEIRSTWISPGPGNTKSESCQEIVNVGAENLRICIIFNDSKKVPKTGLFKITEICSLTVLEARSPNLRTWQGWFLLKGSGGGSVHGIFLFLLETHGITWFAAA